MGICASSHPALTSENPDDYPDDYCVIKLLRALRVPSMDVTSASDPYVRIMAGKRVVHRSRPHMDDSDPEFNELANLTGIGLDDDVTFELWDHDRFNPSDLIGRTTLKLKEVIKRPSMSLLLHKSNGDMVVKNQRNAPTELQLSVIKTPRGWPQPQASTFGAAAPQGGYGKHVLMLTRGTRGDVQPFVALARGLANTKGWIVTICTELAYKDFVLRAGKDLERGAIRFRPAGGDTMSRVDQALCRWAMQVKTELMQIAMVARSEREFFASEPVMFYWAETLTPKVDYLIYGFTVANIAMIISEKLKIPMCGFVLQPTSIKSKQYPPVVPIDTHYFSWLDRVEEALAGHSTNERLKRWMEDDPFSKPLTTMRERRGLRPLKNTNSTEEIVRQGSPVVVPIHPVAFGGKPPDWPESVKMTDFIFLRGGGLPKLKESLLTFIEDAKRAGDPIVAMTFSSMPVSRENILASALKIVNECETHPRVIALAGNHLEEKLSAKTYQALDKATKAGKLFEDSGADFGLLFDYCDALVIHGGLGTTAEALRRGIPVMVVGVLLMDQRFWGNQCSALGVGPDMVHISSFSKVCTEKVDSMLRFDSSYKDAAADLARKIQPTSPDGVPENVEMVVRCLESAKPIDTQSLGGRASLPHVPTPPSAPVVSAEKDAGHSPQETHAAHDVAVDVVEIMVTHEMGVQDDAPEEEEVGAVHVDVATDENDAAADEQGAAVDENKETSPAEPAEPVDRSHHGPIEHLKDEEEEFKLSVNIADPPEPEPEASDPPAPEPRAASEEEPPDLFGDGY